MRVVALGGSDSLWPSTFRGYPKLHHGSPVPGRSAKSAYGLPDKPHRTFLEILIELPAGPDIAPPYIDDVSTVRGETQSHWYPFSMTPPTCSIN
jgi:hypothetical protein